MAQKRRTGPERDGSRSFVAAAILLAEFFRRNGYVRWQNPKRLKAEGYIGYKKGDEVRLVAGSRAELAAIRRLLRRIGLKPARPFPKGGQYRQPIYGREAVAFFLKMVRAATRRRRRGTRLRAKPAL
ncbi:MAG: hypothetical protein HY717_07605 [Planctomycetes bacterium]|nr:hypothetical protein [Planctomycetota bacterium]